MIRRVEVRNFRCFSSLGIALRERTFLLGLNGAGKSAFLDIFQFVADALKTGVQSAATGRSPRFDDLLNNEEKRSFQIHLELELPEDIRKIHKDRFVGCLYQIAVGEDPSGRPVIRREALYLLPDQPPGYTLFPEAKRRSWRTVVSKTEDGNDYFQSEKTKWNNLFRMDPDRPALSHLPEDSERFPAAVWAKRFLMEKIHPLHLQPRALRRASRHPEDRFLLSDGGNLPQVADGLKRRDHKTWLDWIDRLGEFEEKCTDLRMEQHSEDNARYLSFELDGRRFPAWAVNDGLLRFAALSLLALEPEPGGLYLVEELAAGLHPDGGALLLRLLRKSTGTQFLMTTHSPTLAGMLDTPEVLVFVRDHIRKPVVLNPSELEALFERGIVESFQEVWECGLNWEELSDRLREDEEIARSKKRSHASATASDPSDEEEDTEKIESPDSDSGDGNPPF